MQSATRGLRYWMPLLILTLAAGGTILGCGKSSPTPASKPLPTLKRPKAPSASAKASTSGSAVAAGEFNYDPSGFRDPFLSLLQVKKVRDQVPLEELTPLQKVSLADLRLQGIILLGKKGVAQVLTPDGKAHVVTPGTLVGRNRGKVLKITSDEVIVQEEFEDYLGQKVKQETVLRLHTLEGETL